jgi:NitT/TauT family transport system substrate-binding protein
MRAWPLSARPRGWAISALLCLCLAALGVAPAAPAHSAEHVRVAIPVPSLTFLPLYVGVQHGFFAKQGFDVEIVTTSGDGPDIDALISGGVNYTVTTPNRLFLAYQQGNKRIVGIANLMNRMAIDCWMNKALAQKLHVSVETPLKQRIMALKGQTVSGTRPGAFTYLLLVNYAMRFGLEPQKDIKIIGIGGPNALIPAVENGAIAVACTGDPAPELAGSRGKAIMFTNNVGGTDPAYDNFMFEVLHARRDYAQSHADEVHRMIRGFLDSIAFIYDGPEPQVVAAMKKYFTATSDDLLLQSLRRLRPAFPRDGRFNQESVEKSAKFFVAAGVLKKVPNWSDLVTNQYLPK